MVFTPATASSSQIVTLPDIPELYNPNFLDVLIPISRKAERLNDHVEDKNPKNPMIDALQATAYQTFTDNLAPAYSSTHSATLDVFQILSYHTPKFDEYLEKSWTEDPELTLRIIWNIRSIHDGKGDRELFYKTFGWLYDNHPRTAISNLHLLVEPVCTSPKTKQSLAHGYWKDLLNIITLATVDGFSQPSHFLHVYRAKNPTRNLETSEDKLLAQEKRTRVGVQRYENLVAKLSQPKYRALYIAIARLFSERLVKDLHILDELDALSPDAKQIHLLKQLSLVGKWAPTPHGAHDRHTNIATAVILLLRHAQTPSPFPAALDTTLEPRDSALILRSYYQRWVLTRLRSVMALPEPLMSANRWKEIKYNRVSSISMKNNADHFYEHDPDGFQKYLISVESGQKTISGATLFPHELIAEAIALGRDMEYNGSSKYPALKEFKKIHSETKMRVVDAQWKTLIARLRESGAIENALAICDVSGSMGSLSYGYKSAKNPQSVEPILPAISLSLVLAHLAPPPFNGGFITFSARPQYVQLDLSQPLHKIVHDMDNADWGMNTDLNAVFLKLLLPLALKHNVAQEDMIKRLFVFSDMQFDECRDAPANTADWTTNHDVIEASYKEAGYKMPQIVYWDLAEEGTVEVQSDRKGVALMNGFSPALLKVFMGESEGELDEWESIRADGDTETVVAEEFNPLNMMKRAVMRKSFDGLVVVD